MGEPILQVTGVSVAYGNRKKIQVLNDISFSIEKGEILGLVGESGCGKSTLAKAILGLTPYTGEITHHSRYPQMVFQDPYGSLNPARKISFSMEEPLRLRSNLTKEERQEKMVQMMARVGLDPKLLSRYPRQLSGGQRQRICIGIALMQEPQLLIADEPVSALDVTIQAQVLDLLLKLQKEMGLSILFISHDLRVVYKMCDRVMIMQKGKIIESGAADQVYFEPKQPYTKTLLQSAGISC